MTVLAALWTRDGRPTAGACGAMLRAQGAYADRSEVTESRGIAMGRGSRLGLAGDEGGTAPIEGAGGALILVADARLDNRPDLLARLGLATPSDLASSDALLMMRCFEKWGDQAVDLFVGDFALALWDGRSQRLLLARDFAGQRPLFYCEAGAAVAVASMARGLHALDFVPRGVDEARLLELLAGLPHEGPKTSFRGIARVEPGEAVVFRDGGRSSRFFWSPPSGEIRLGSPGEYAEALLSKLDEAVAARLRGAKDAVGTHLSAGLDSSAVASSAALAWSGPVLAFTSVPSGRLPPLPKGRFGDEGVIAAETAAMYPNIEHHLIRGGDRLPLEALGRQIETYERSDLNLPNLLWAERINDAAAAAGIKVMLVGTTGNATISYGGPEVLGQLLVERRFGAYLAECLAAGRAGWSGRTLLGLLAKYYVPRPLARSLLRLRRRERHPASVGALNPAYPGAAEVIARYEQVETRTAASLVEVRLQMLRRVDFGTYNKGVLMRWGIDLRDPTADRRLVEFCVQVPLDQYFRNGTSRALIREALRGRVPQSVLSNPLRGLQSADWFSLLGGARDEMERLLERIRTCEAARGILDVDEMQRRLESWPLAPESFGSMAYRYGLLRGLSVGEFIRIYSSDHPLRRASAPAGREGACQSAGD
jgi:asparagine synthase (glutamine-hydrolysing)